MRSERIRQAVLGLLVIALIGVLWRVAMPATSAGPSPTSNPQARAATPRQAQKSAAATAPAAPGVHLDALNAERPEPDSTERNLFRFKPKAPPPPPPAPPRPVQPIGPETPVATGPPPPPPLAPITLKFIGVVEATSHGDKGEKIAILSDGRNAPFYGKEGAIIEGRYRILKIGVESVELAYADGRGRQTIRLTGS